MNTIVETGQPNNEPVSLAMAKLQLCIDTDFTDDDNLISAYITSARMYCESYTERSFLPRTAQYTLDSFPLNYQEENYKDFWHMYCITIPTASVQSVQSITYNNLFGNQITIDSSCYSLDSNSCPARIVPVYGQYWPTDCNNQPSNIVINFTAGSYTDTVPMPIQQAILLLVTAWYSNRAAFNSGPNQAIPFGVDALLAPYKMITWMV